MDSTTSTTMNETWATKRTKQMLGRAETAREYRVRQKRVGRPTAVKADQAIAEAVAFLARGLVPGTTTIKVADIYTVAKLALLREGYDRAESKHAVASRLKPRLVHEEFGRLPTLRLDTTCVSPPRRDGDGWRDSDIAAAKRIGDAIKAVHAVTAS